MSRLMRQGFSLVEVMIALGLTGSFGLLVSQMTNSQIRNVRAIQIGSDVEGWGSELRHALSDESVCKEALWGRTIPAVGRTIQLQGFNAGSQAAGILKGLGAWMGAEGSGAKLTQLQIATVAGPLMEVGLGSSMKREYLLRLDATLSKQMPGGPSGKAGEWAASVYFRALVNSSNAIQGCSRGGSLEEACSGSGGVLLQVVCPPGGCSGSRESSTGTAGGSAGSGAVIMQGSTVSQCVAASPSDCSKVGLSFDSGTKRCVLSKPPTPCDPAKQVAVGMQLNCPVGGECALAMKCHPIPWASKSWQCPAGSFSRGIDPSTYTPVCVSYPSISSAQNCYGEWHVDCENARLTYKVHVQASGGGAACPHADGFVKKATTGDCPSCQWLPQRPIQCEPKCGGVRLMQCADAVGSACAPSLCGPKPADVACSDPSCPPTDCHFCDSRPECGSDTGDCKPETLGALFCRCRIQPDGTRVCSTYRAGSRYNCP